MTGGWRSTLGREARATAAAVRGAPRAVVVREVALQVLAATLDVAGTAIGVGALSVALPVPATALVLLARLRWPAAATVVVGGLITFSGPGAWLAAPLVAFREGRRESSPRRLLVVLASAGALCLALTPLVPEEAGPLVQLLASLAGVVFLLGVPALCGVLLGGRRPVARLLAERNDHLERARSLTVLQGRLQERARIAAEMHDVLGHRLSLLSVHAGVLEVRTAQEAPRLSEHANLVRATAVAALDELRATLDATRSAADRPSPGPEGSSGSAKDVAAVAESWRQVGVDVAVLWDDEVGDFDPRVGRAVDRAVREGLTNVHNTAPASDTSPGPGTRLGLLGLTERAALLGGCARWGPTEQGGFGLVLDVPSHPPASPEPSGAASSAALRLPTPPPVHGADVLTWRRMAVVGVLAGVLAVPLALVLTIVVVELFVA